MYCTAQCNTCTTCTRSTGGHKRAAVVKLEAVGARTGGRIARAARAAVGTIAIIARRRTRAKRAAEGTFVDVWLYINKGSVCIS